MPRSVLLCALSLCAASPKKKQAIERTAGDHLHGEGNSGPRLRVPVLLAGYANGCVGYVAPAACYPAGGYAVCNAHLVYGRRRRFLSACGARRSSLPRFTLPCRPRSPTGRPPAQHRSGQRGDDLSRRRCVAGARCAAAVRGSLFCVATAACRAPQSGSGR